jgi:hypothetical protein
MYRTVFAVGRDVAWDKAATFDAQRGIDTETVESGPRNNIARS